MTYRPSRWLPVLGLGAASLVACSSPKEEEPVAKSTQAVSTTLVISQVYGGGGGTGTYKADYVEITNIGSSSVALGGMSIQYASATGNSWSHFDFPVFSLAPGKRYLVQLASSGSAPDLPVTADATGTINMSGTAGKVALVNSTTPLTCGGTGDAGGGRCPSGSYIDMVGYGTTATDYEGSVGPAGAPSTTSAVVRKNGGCQDTDDNAGDFEVVTAPVPRNNASPAVSCGTDAGSDADGATDAADAADGATDATDASDAADGGADTDDGAADSGAADSGAADTTVADTTVADTTTADTTTADTTTADTTTADSTAADSAADSADDTTPPEDTGTTPTDTGTAPSDTGSAVDGGADTGTIAPAETETDSGCGCATPGTSTSDRTTQGALAAILVGGLLARRRRR